MTCPIRNRMDQPAVEAGHLPQLSILGHVALPKRMQLAERWPSTAYRSDSVQLEMFGRTKYHCTLSQARIPGVARTVQFTCQQKRTKFHSFAMINAMINQKWELRCPTGGTLDPAGEGGGGGGALWAGSAPSMSGSRSQVAWYQDIRGTTHRPPTCRGAVCTPSCAHISLIAASFPAGQKQ